MTTKALKLRELAKGEDRFAHGHRMCAGCGAPIVVKQVLMATDYPIIAANATGCLEVSSCIQQFTAWKIPWMHSALKMRQQPYQALRRCTGRWSNRASLKIKM